MKLTKTLIEIILDRDNLNQAFERVRRNKGAAGVDAKDIEATRLHLLLLGKGKIAQWICFFL
ncbi:phage-related minor tail protein [Bacillus sp. V2I10]|nr:phage-related minor tail protein [Bacillus sp. V2I10]